MLFSVESLKSWVYRLLHPVPFLLGARQENFWMSCPTVQEIGGLSPKEDASIIEERCHFPFWYKGRLRYECVEREGATISSQVIN